jgi:hypothetical protein
MKNPEPLLVGQDCVKWKKCVDKAWNQFKSHSFSVVTWESSAALYAIRRRSDFSYVFSSNTKLTYIWKSRSISVIVVSESEGWSWATHVRRSASILPCQIGKGWVSPNAGSVQHCNLIGRTEGEGGLQGRWWRRNSISCSMDVGKSVKWERRCQHNVRQKGWRCAGAHGVLEEWCQLEVHGGKVSVCQH